MNDCIAALNCGSSSIKLALLDTSLDPLPHTPTWNSTVEGVGTEYPTVTEADTLTQVLELDAAQPYHAVLMHVRQRVEQRLEGRRLKAMAHQMVHDDTKYFAPVRVNAEAPSDLHSYIPLASLHQSFVLEAIKALLLSLSDVPQVACFDTTFHRTLLQVETMLPLPYVAWGRGLRRYSFRGLSYRYMSIALPERHGDAAHRRTIVAHLGSGMSSCAMIGLKGVATTMGSSAFEGLIMGTRCGPLDPRAMLYMMEMEHPSPAQIGHMLYHEPDLLGVLGLSSDPHDPISRGADNPRVRATSTFYVRRIIREVGALVAVFGGSDLLVFMAGIGEHNAVLRGYVAGGLGYLGASLNGEADRAHAAITSSLASRIRVTVEPTNEERMAAWHAVQCNLQ